MGNILGIDLGASYAKAVWIRGNEAGGSPTLRAVLNPLTHEPMFRVCGQRTPAGALELLDNDGARKAAVDAGATLVENVKPLRGEPGSDDVLEILVLETILDAYKSVSGDADFSALEEVVLTHPVQAGPAHLEALHRIATDAGLPADRLSTIEEPVALGVYAMREDPEFRGRLFVIDAGHYSTDLVYIDFDPDTKSAAFSGYLPLRLGVGELCHAIARDMWLKLQRLAGQKTPRPFPFDTHGPEATHPVVGTLCAWAEVEVIRGLEYGTFGVGIGAQIYPWTLHFDAPFDWVNSVDVPVQYDYDLSTAQQEDFAASLDLDPRAKSQTARWNYRESIRAHLLALNSVALAALLDTHEVSPSAVALGGGMSLIPEVRDGVSRLLQMHGLPGAKNLEHHYPGLGELPMGSLLAPAAGAALIGTGWIDRGDTLAESLAVRYWPNSMDEALELLAEDHDLPDDPEGLNRWLSDNCDVKTAYVAGTERQVMIMPLYRVVLPRGTPLPARKTLETMLETHGDNPVIWLARLQDPAIQHAVPQDRAGSPSPIGEIQLEAGSRGLSVTFEVEMNDVWRVTVTDASGRVVASEDDVLSTFGRGGG